MSQDMFWSSRRNPVACGTIILADVSVDVDLIALWITEVTNESPRQNINNASGSSLSLLMATMADLTMVLA